MTAPRGIRFRTAALAALAFTLVCAPHAQAQTRLYLNFTTGSNCQPIDCAPAHLLELDVDGGRVLADTLLPQARVSAPQVTPDGRFLVWRSSDFVGTSASVNVFDTSARQQSTSISAGLSGSALFSHPSITRMFVQLSFGADITVLEPSGLRTLPNVCSSGMLQAMSGDGSRLAVLCPSTTTLPGWIEVIDSATGTGVATVTPPSFPNRSLHQALNETGTELYVATYLNSSNITASIERYDLASGDILATTSVGSRGGVSIKHDPHSGRLFVFSSDLSRGIISALDDATLQLVGSVTGPAWLYAGPDWVAFDPDRPRMYALWRGQAQDGTSDLRHRVASIDTETMTTVAEANLASDAPAVGLVLGPRPPRATTLSSSVTGSAVNLQWTNQESRSVATGLVVEAGASPGASNLARLTAAAGSTTLTVPNVPRGTYYVRVRSVNGTGLGEPSNEVVVVVP